MHIGGNKILYLGSGLHIEPVLHFKKSKEFIFIDIEPRNEYDNGIFTTSCYNSHFYKNLIDKCKSYGFMLYQTCVIDKDFWKIILSFKQKTLYLCNKLSSMINPTLLIFINPSTRQKIKYYISTNILYNMNAELKEDIESADIFIFHEYLSQTKILEYFNKPKVFVAYQNNVFNMNNHNEKTLASFLINNICSLSYYFNEYYLIKEVEKEKGVIEIKAFDNFTELKNEVEVEHGINLTWTFTEYYV